MIQINQQPVYPISRVELYSPNHEFLGYVTKWQLMDVRIQIAEQKVSGYYFKFINTEREEVIINISDQGKVDKWSDDLFDQSESLNQAIKLRNLQPPPR